MTMAQVRHIRILPSGPDTEVLDEVVEYLRAGGVLAYPTGTVYGLGCLLLEEPLEALARIKSRPPGKPFLLLLPPGGVSDWVRGTAVSERLAQEFWPGPLTLVLRPADHHLSRHVVGPEGGVAVRRDAHPLLDGLLERLGEPITSSSLNTPGARPAATGDEAMEMLGKMDVGEGVWLLDAGRTPTTKSSTILDLTGSEPRVIREGAIPVERIAQVLPSLSSYDPESGINRAFRVLFVCTGNTCRSPLAEVLALDMARSRGLSNVSISSAGVFAAAGAPASQGALDSAARAGLDLSGHRSRPLSHYLLEESDLILTMTKGHLESLRMMDVPSVATTLGAFATGDPSDPGQDVSDPIGGSAAVYDATLDELRRLVTHCLDRLAARIAQ